MAAVAKTIVWFMLINPVGVDRPDELILISADRLQGISPAQCVVKIEDTIIPSQPEDLDFDGEADALAVLVDLKPYQAVRLSVEPQDSPPVFPKQAHAEISLLAERSGEGAEDGPVDNGRYISYANLRRDPGHEIHDGLYRFEGPLIESDLIGYRLYWDERGAIDVYGKISDQFIGQAHRMDQSHHTLQSWGRDLLHNGSALGVGGLGIGSADERISPAGAPVARLIIGADGPVRASMRMIYEGITINGTTVDLTWDISMSAGSRYMSHNVNVTRGGPLNLLAALTNHHDLPEVSKRESMALGASLDWVGTYGKQTWPDEDPIKAELSDEKMGLALLWEHHRMQDFNQSEVEFAVEFKPTSAVSYYSLAAYNREPGPALTSDVDFYAYLNDLAFRLAHPVIIESMPDKAYREHLEDNIDMAWDHAKKNCILLSRP